MRRSIVLTLSLALCACSVPIRSWHETIRLSTQDGPIKYTFPSTLREQERDRLIDECKKSVAHAVSVIHLEYLPDSIDVEFFATRREMQKCIGQAASGMAFPETKAMFCLIGDNTHPPIQHETMHMVAMLA